MHSAQFQNHTEDFLLCIIVYDLTELGTCAKDLEHIYNIKWGTLIPGIPIIPQASIIFLIMASWTHSTIHSLWSYYTSCSFYTTLWTTWTPTVPLTLQHECLLSYLNGHHPPRKANPKKIIQLSSSQSCADITVQILLKYLHFFGLICFPWIPSKKVSLPSHSNDFITIQSPLKYTNIPLTTWPHAAATYRRVPTNTRPTSPTHPTMHGAKSCDSTIVCT